MRGKLWFFGGAAVGFVIGARAGRERYDQLVSTARRMWDHPTVQEAAGVVQAQANRLYAEGKDTVTERLSNSKLGERFRHPESESGGELGQGAGDDSLAGTGQRPPGSTF
jgi:hypothetical protein